MFYPLICGSPLPGAMVREAAGVCFPTISCEDTGLTRRFGPRNRSRPHSFSCASFDEKNFRRDRFC